MIAAAVSHNGSWTRWHLGETQEEFIARIPASESAPDGDCDKEDEWKTEGGTITIHVCARCGDKPPAQCEADFQALVTALKAEFPPDP